VLPPGKENVNGRLIGPVYWLSPSGPGVKPLFSSGGPAGGNHALWPAVTTKPAGPFDDATITCSAPVAPAKSNAICRSANTS
jgi:hypothetical protein